MFEYIKNFNLANQHKSNEGNTTLLYPVTYIEDENIRSNVKLTYT